MNKVRTRRQNTSKNRKKRNTRNNRNTRNTRKRKVSIKRRRVKSKRRVSSLKGGAFCGSRPGGSRGRPKLAAFQGFVEMSDNDKQKTLAEVERKIQEGTDSYMEGWTHTKDDYAAFIRWLEDNEQKVLDNYDYLIHDEIIKKFAEKREWAGFKLKKEINRAAPSLR